MTPADFIRSKVRLDDVHIVGGRRPVNQAAVSTLASSMAKIGLMIPISIRVVDDVMIEGQPIRAAVLVAGNHRLEAARQLGWSEIDCVYMQGDETDARMWEIAENLHRAELTALERDEQVAEWVRLAAVRDQSRQADAIESKRQDGRGHRREGGTSAAARELGLSEPDARRATKVASLSPEAKEAARELGLDDNRSALLEAAKSDDPTEQVTALQEKAATRRKTKAEEPDHAAERIRDYMQRWGLNRNEHDVDAVGFELDRLNSLWMETSESARRVFVAVVISRDMQPA